jgi:hypothetical protein
MEKAMKAKTKGNKGPDRRKDRNTALNKSSLSN